jgi:hypothetical protein
MPLLLIGRVRLVIEELWRVDFEPIVPKGGDVNRTLHFPEVMKTCHERAEERVLCLVASRVAYS